jgi:hypothetical protein
MTTMVGARERIRFSWIHSAWLFIIMAAHVVTIFALMRFSQGAHWTVFNSMLTLCMPPSNTCPTGRVGPCGRSRCWRWPAAW